MAVFLNFVFSHRKLMLTELNAHAQNELPAASCTLKRNNNNGDLVLFK